MMERKARVHMQTGKKPRQFLIFFMTSGVSHGGTKFFSRLYTYVYIYENKRNGEVCVR